MFATRISWATGGTASKARHHGVSEPEGARSRCSEEEADHIVLNEGKYNLVHITGCPISSGIWVVETRIISSTDGTPFIVVFLI